MAAMEGTEMEPVTEETEDEESLEPVALAEVAVRVAQMAELVGMAEMAVPGPMDSPATVDQEVRAAQADRVAIMGDTQVPEDLEGRAMTPEMEAQVEAAAKADAPWAWAAMMVERGATREMVEPPTVLVVVESVVREEMEVTVPAAEPQVMVVKEETEGAPRGAMVAAEAEVGMVGMNSGLESAETEVTAATAGRAPTTVVTAEGEAIPLVAGLARDLLGPVDVVVLQGLGG